MGQKDVVLARYFEENARFADLVNGFLFDGVQAVSGQDISEKSVAVNGILGRLMGRFTYQKYRDIVRRVALGMRFAVIGVENQDLVHYAMPVRVMLEDAAGYDEQMRRIQRLHRGHRDLRGAEYVGRFSRKDRLEPVFTIVIYYGSEPWDGARDLYGLLDLDQLPPAVSRQLNNFRLNLLELRSFEHLDAFRTDLREVFGFIRRANDKRALLAFTEERRERFEHMEEDAFDVITTLTGLDRLAGIKAQCMDEGGKVDMCEGMRQLLEDSLNEGIEKGMKQGMERGMRQGLKQGEVSQTRKVAHNMYLRGMSAEDAAAICEMSLEQIESWFREWAHRR